MVLGPPGAARLHVRSAAEDAGGVAAGGRPRHAGSPATAAARPQPFASEAPAHPGRRLDGIRVLPWFSSAFLAQQIAQELLPEPADEAPSRMREAAAAYAAMAGRAIEVIGPSNAAGSVG
jgi:hypothetical protein